MNVKLFQDTDSFIDSSVTFIQNICNQNKNIYVGLSGGSTPTPIYKKLGQNNICFNNVECFQVDERYVPKDDKDSNFKIINNSLFKEFQIEKNEFHYFDTSLDINNCLKKYSDELSKIPKKTFDLTILGIGEDGHFASLFPNSPALDEKDKLCSNTQTDKHPVRERLTISRDIILKSKKILVLMKGGKKRIILDKLNKNLDYHSFPAYLLKNHPDVNLFYCIV